MAIGVLLITSVSDKYLAVVSCKQALRLIQAVIYPIVIQGSDDRLNSKELSRITTSVVSNQVISTSLCESTNTSCVFLNALYSQIKASYDPSRYVRNRSRHYFSPVIVEVASLSPDISEDAAAITEKER